MAAATSNGLAQDYIVHASWMSMGSSRAHCSEELQLSYEEVIIDLDRPRDEWYLKVNPVGSLYSPPSISAN
jgi:glutathione S-transferase